MPQRAEREPVARCLMPLHNAGTSCLLGRAARLGCDVSYLLFFFFLLLLWFWSLLGRYE